MWYLGPHRGFITHTVKSYALPLPVHNVSTELICILQVYPAYCHPQAFIGGISANSIISPSHCTDHPLRALSSFLHPLTVFSTLLLGGSIVAFGFTISVVLLTLVWVICSYSINLIQPYPRPSPPVSQIPADPGIKNMHIATQLKSCIMYICHVNYEYTVVQNYYSKPMNDSRYPSALDVYIYAIIILYLFFAIGDFCVKARQAVGGTLSTLLSLVIDYLFPFGFLVHCGFVTFQLSAVLILYLVYSLQYLQLIGRLLVMTMYGELV